MLITVHTTKNPKYRKIVISLQYTDEFTYTMQLNIHPYRQQHISQICNSVKHALSSSANVSRQHRRPHVSPNEQIFDLSTNYVIRGINVMIAIDLEIHDNAFLKIKSSIPHEKIGESLKPRMCIVGFEKTLTLDFKNVKFFVYTG